MQVYAKVTATMDAKGLGEIALKVPGTFTTLDPTDPIFSGRNIYYADVWFAKPISGDSIIQATIEDRDQILVAVFGDIKIVLEMFPAYPILGSWADPDLPAENQVLYFLPNSATRIAPPSGNSKVASGMYLVLKLQKVAALADNVFGNIVWIAPEPERGGANTSTDAAVSAVP